MSVWTSCDQTVPDLLDDILKVLYTICGFGIAKPTKNYVQTTDIDN